MKAEISKLSSEVSGVPRLHNAVVAEAVVVVKVVVVKVVFVAEVVFVITLRFETEQFTCSKLCC